MFLPKYPGRKGQCPHVLRGNSPERSTEQHSFGTPQCEARLGCYHTKSNAIKKENFNKDTAEKFHSVRVKREGRWKAAKSAS